jgi:hypothetical protein
MGLFTLFRQWFGLDVKPGVYVEEKPTSAVPAKAPLPMYCVGEFERGPVESSVPVVSYKEFRGVFGEESRLAKEVYKFFKNGGRKVFITRVMPREDK